MLIAYTASNLTNTSLSDGSGAVHRADTLQAYAADREKTLNKKQLAKLAREQKAELKRAQKEARKEKERLVEEAKKEKKERKRRERRRITKAAPTRRPSFRREDFAVSAEIVPQVPISHEPRPQRRYYAS
jgi:hypothetical protein